MSGLLAAVRLRPEWRFERAEAMAERCRELLTGQAGADVIVPDNRATIVSWRSHEETPGGRRRAPGRSRSRRA